MVPAYVGQAKAGFRNECFDHHKLTHYNTALVKRKSGTPIMFFVCKEEGSTHEFEACIDRVENLLIQFALTRNHELTNVHIGDWCIQGVYRGGRRSQFAKLFRQLMGMETDDDSHDEDESDGPAPTSTSALINENDG